MTPVTLSWRELGLDIDEINASLKPFTERDENRKILAAGQISGSFDDFLKTRNVKYQKGFFGENRYRMWKDGEIKVDDLIDKNGQLRLLTKDRYGLLGKAMPVVKIPVAPVKIVVKKPVFVPAKDIEDARKWTKKNIGVKKVLYSDDADIDFLNKMNERLLYLKKDFPETISSIKKIDATGTLGYTASMEVDAIMLSKGGGSNLLVSRMAAQNFKEIDAFYNVGHKAGKFATAGVDGAIDHEIGHAVRNKLRQIDMDGSFDFSKKLHAMGQESFPSTYAAVNNNETFAECFSEMIGKPKKDWSESTKVLSEYLSKFKGEI